ncbi:Molecular chaperone TorD family protein [Rhodovastum atsumiense]|uniref:Molecular chaperone TorD family protein n=1 Tax=Rhodovastum atsumiense TaxID=504468 RepID=A0A5M6IZX9_9PROT|nr:molecular chaperone TorD family protein [Rhodovastum atsumiense]KAA5613529.1 molecular chaperone TorD family protein [Rhodovastum atsumiense]CAH2603279.1 Molecular chaperone TorD family protein [Rhodovastum atsumiense]
MTPLLVGGGVLWRWLSGVFAAPLDATSLQACRTGMDEIEALCADPTLAPGLRRMRDALAALPVAPACVALLAHDHTLLFSGAGGPATVPPYESAFTEPGGRLFGAAETRMRSLLADLGLRLAPGVVEPSDHIAIEFLAMAELSEAAGPSPRRTELLAALCNWLPAFRDACLVRDSRGFYAGAAMLAAALAAAAWPAASQETLEEC